MFCCVGPVLYTVCFHIAWLCYCVTKNYLRISLRKVNESDLYSYYLTILIDTMSLCTLTQANEGRELEFFKSYEIDLLLCFEKVT